MKHISQFINVFNIFSFFSFFFFKPIKIQRAQTKIKPFQCHKMPPPTFITFFYIILFFFIILWERMVEDLSSTKSICHPIQLCYLALLSICDIAVIVVNPLLSLFDTQISFHQKYRCFMSIKMTLKKKLAHQ
eukprot:101444_1